MKSHLVLLREQYFTLQCRGVKMGMRDTERPIMDFITKVQSDIATLQELWEELTNTLESRAGFGQPSDAILFSFDAGVYQAYINLITEYTTSSSSVDAEVVIDRAISMAFVLKHLEEVLNRAYVPFKDIEWISWLISQSRSTLFSIMMSSQEFIMGE